jgi:hypothetical protein
MSFHSDIFTFNTKIEWILRKTRYGKNNNIFSPKKGKKQLPYRLKKTILKQILSYLMPLDWIKYALLISGVNVGHSNSYKYEKKTKHTKTEPNDLRFN